jgi:hypothetical protein
MRSKKRVMKEGMYGRREKKRVQNEEEEKVNRWRFRNRENV